MISISGVPMPGPVRCVVAPDAAGRDGKLMAVDAGFELLFCAGTGLGELDTGAWPCGDGNLRGNPVSWCGP